MDQSKIRAWYAHRQGLDGSLDGKSAAEVLGRTGWARSVGGTGPYLTLFSRAGIRREQADNDAANCLIHELPAARGCTYVVPADDFALALRTGAGFGDAAEIKLAKKHFDFTDKEFDRLCTRVVDALAKEPKDPRELKEIL